MSPIDWAMRPLKKYADFSGRAQRAEFWWFGLLIVVLVVVAMIIENIAGLDKMFLTYGPLTLAVLMATLVPSLAVQTRRLHDTNRPGWWLVAFYVLYGIYMFLTFGSLEAIAAGDMSSVASVGLAAIAMLIFSIVLIVFYVRKGTQGDNRYGPDPLAGEPAYA